MSESEEMAENIAIAWFDGKYTSEQAKLTSELQGIDFKLVEQFYGELYYETEALTVMIRPTSKVNNMETVKTQLFIHKGFDDKPMVATSDMRSYGCALLGTHEVEVPVPEVDVVEAEIEALYEQAGVIEAEALDKVLAIREKAKKLRGDQGE